MNYKPFDGTISICDKVALITGAASGIGKATALAFAKSGAKLVLIDMNPAVEDYAKELAEQFSVETLPIVCDLTLSATGKMIVDKTDEKFGTHRHTCQCGRHWSRRLRCKSYRRNVG